MNKRIISPISIDLGAKNTGVYFAHYPADSPLDVFKDKGAKAGKVYQLDSKNYTYLMANRTAKRHQRRGFDRRQMAKRLFKLIWGKHFGLKWDEDIQQTISFLMNRRGFSFLTEEYDSDILSQFPKEAFDELPSELKIEQNDNGDYDFDSVLNEWANEGVEKVKPMFEAINREPKEIRRKLFIISKTKKLHEYCSTRVGGENIPEEGKRANLSKLARWVLENWAEKGMQGLPAIPENTIDMVEYLNKQEPETAKKILKSLPDFVEEKKIKELVWTFDAEKFDMEKEKENFYKDGVPNVKTHLHHLTFALGNMLNELESGGRHRSKYFEEVEAVLTNENHKHGYLKKFCEKLQSKEIQSKGLTVGSLHNLIGHISNLELKPLRKYFNDKKHKITKENKEGDQWSEQEIAKLFERWILSEWRVGEKDKDKAENKKGDYKKLCEQWTQFRDIQGNHQINEKQKKEPLKVVDFWVKTNPFLTIPPYQDNNNRRPPKCQSLILNAGFLKSKYPKWQSWLQELKSLQPVKDYLGDYKGKIKELKSGKGKIYFSEDKDYKGSLLKDSGRRSMVELDARVLQFILDRVKAEDPLNLNEIYSHAKKYKQSQSTDEEKKDSKKKLEKAINNSGVPENSRLPKELNTIRNYAKSKPLFEEGTFLHLVCKYYKQRQRARDGRIYIHPEYRLVKGRGYETTGRFDDENHLLTYCNHKPRQKRYQMLGDLAGLLQVSSKSLEKIAEQREGKTIDDKLFTWLNGIDRLKANCDRAANEQKERRGQLKLDIQNVFVHNKSSKVNDAPKLHNFCVRAQTLCLNIAKFIYDNSRQEEWEKELKKNPATAVYLLAQINNIVFKERNGNANTCAVCSTDNAHRMQMVLTMDGQGTTAKAQRLPAIPTRIIDGAVKRIARIVGSAIANDKWQKIKGELETNNKVCVPIITESNRFEFEPDLKTLKGRRLTDKDKKHQQSDLLTDKEERIKSANQDTCPYTGTKLDGQGQIDHIIPRSSKWGTLNDETNLIYASVKGNNDKGKFEYSLKNLKEKYKQSVFGTTDDGKIQEWIIKQIGDGSGEKFRFGKYHSFINLEPEHQTAFRHALFLVGNPLRDKVINTINNKNRALVNGTQRYFAEVLANTLYKKAKHIGREGLLSFDYYGVEAQFSTRGDGISDLRKLYEEDNPEIAVYAKSRDIKQQAYSHLLDAQLAFVIVADAHRKEGGLKLQIDNKIRKEPYDVETGEIYDGMLKYIQVPDDEFETHELSRKTPSEIFSAHRSFTRDTFYADHYVPVLLKCEDNSVIVKVGFNWQDSVELKTDTRAKHSKVLENLIHILPLCNETQELVGKQYANLNDLFAGMQTIQYFVEQLQTNTYCYLTINKIKLHEYWKEHYNTKTGKQFQGNAFVYKTLGYKTEKVAITKPEDLSDVLNNPQKNFILTVDNQSITLPVQKQWQTCFDRWNEQENQGLSFSRFLRFYFKPHTSGAHQKTRKVFSLPVLTGQGKLMLRRKSWSGGYIYQIMNDSDSRKTDNKPNVPIRKEDGSLGIKLAQWAESSNFVKLSHDEYELGETINPIVWYMVDKDKYTLPDEIEQLWYRIDDSTAPSIAIKLARDGYKIENAEFMEEKICQHGFRKQEAKKATKTRPEQPEKSPQDIRDEFFQEKIRPKKQGAIVFYKGKQYNTEMKKAFRTVQLVDSLK